MITNRNWRTLRRALALGVLSFVTSSAALAVNIANDPLFLEQPVRPIVMLNMSNDHQLFFKAYDDYSDLTGDGRADTSYVHNHSYYGYFDSQKCYTYSTQRNYFVPARFADQNNYCNAGSSSGEWSGNFLNWASMTRMDTVRKILYGGLRSTDTANTTVLERAMLPQDAHSFAKYYNGSDLGQLTPFGGAEDASGNDVTSGGSSMNSGITICNTTEPGNRNQLSQDVTAPPLMRVARGNFSLWASNERWQCRWRNNVGGDQGKNDNNFSYSGINAHSESPYTSRRLGGRDLHVRVSVCVNNLIDETNNENCSGYDNGLQKPAGLLQEYGEDGSILFGLMTGSYSKNKSGGVLRRNVGDLSNEVNSDGTFVNPGSNNDLDDGIINTLDSLRIYGYRFDDGTYHRNSHGIDPNGSDGCLWSRSSFVDGQCSNWGNPQSEIYLESLKYLAGLDATSAYNGDDSDYIDGLESVSWTRPLSNDNYCAPLNIIQFNASTTSFDGDLASDAASGFGLESIDAVTNEVGQSEGLHGNSYFVGAIAGATGQQANQLCTPKTVNNLSTVRGTCPDAPRLDGSYKMAGLAYHARSTGITLQGVTSASSASTVRTYGVALAPAVPQINIPVPSSSDREITLLPACRNNNNTLDSPANCAIVDFKVVSQEEESTNGTVTARTGQLYVNWEDSEQGGDFDQDMWGVIEYRVTSDEVSVTTQVIAQSTGDPMGFGYVIGGTTQDGFHVQSGVNNFTYTSVYQDRFSCSGNVGSRCSCRINYGGTTGPCNYSNADAQARTQTFSIGPSSAELLQSPLFYAAKWGGYPESVGEGEVSEWSPENETYFFATDPGQLQDALRNAFARVAAGVGSASAVATNTTNLQEGAFVFQARFNSENWSGELLAFPVDDNGNISDVVSHSTNETMMTGVSRPLRRIISVDENGNQIPFEWESLSASQQALLNAEDGMGEARLNWLWGVESTTSGLRQRQGLLLGDIVNSSPEYLGGENRGYSRLEGSQGSSYAQYLQDTKRQQPETLFVGANDGMLHAFDVENNVFDELFAYVPGGVYDKLAALSAPNYGRQENPHQYTVDGQMAVGDVYLDGSWRSVVVGSLGAGGKGVFALDVTDRSNPEVLFELSGGDLPALGHVMGKPLIARMANGRWAVVFGNGYNSSDGTSQLLVVEFERPGSPHVINTEAGQGLSGVALLGNAYGQVQAAYAGDLQGNLWKFDLSASNPNQWEEPLGEPMFVAKDDGGARQPIFGAPTLGRNDEKNNVIMVYFGTGKYFEKNDNNVTNNDPSAHSFYAIADKGEAYGSDRETFLHEKTLVDGQTTRSVSGESDVDWTTDDGWFLDFNTRLGERVIAKPLLLYDRLIFATIIPSSTPCQFGGQSWLMELKAVGNRFVNSSVLDNDGTNGNTLTDALILGDPTHSILNSEAGKLLYSSSDGDLGEQDTNIPAGALGRQSWRQLR
ncbi:pilus assembly protein [Marinimicrobium sp. ARAG 43.8]|uniref:pilus assembly protein n=1 Tax=Marinimicrobium sp. ARAG 43.8 TaxID=3418719 RepID=UPI003CE95F54